MPDHGKPRLIRNCRLNLSPVQGDTLLMPEGVLKLKGTGASIVALCDGVRSLDEIVAALKLKYSTTDPKLVESEARAFLSLLREKRVLDF